MEIIGYIVIGIYVIALSYVTFYCLMQFNLLIHYRRYHRKSNDSSEDLYEEPQEWPFVTIQLPIYNEMYVVERLIDNIIKLDYPKNRLEIQVLDDSTDETLKISENKVEQYKQLGFDIHLVRREDRSGYKAGALKEGMKYVKGELIAIFDADFLPNPDFLKRTVPYFNDEKVGVVQTRWDHINQNYSLLTQLQAFQLNVHFTVEQKGREAADYMLQFNGTAGLWRKETIIDAGGWEADTLTEDLDLSYRAQLKGWKIEFLEDVTAPAELPSEMNGLKSQQFRWMKGGAETAKKMLPTVWKSSIPLNKKIQASLHLLSSTVFLFVFIIGVFSVPSIFFLNPMGLTSSLLTIFMVGLLSIIIVYYNANIKTSWKSGSYWAFFMKFVLIFPIFLAISMGLSLHNSIAVMQGYLGKKSAFIRTPKFDIKGISDSFKNHNYIAKRIGWTTIMEGLMVVYFVMGIYAGYVVNNGAFFLFHILLVIGYGFIFYTSVKHLKR